MSPKAKPATFKAYKEQTFLFPCVGSVILRTEDNRGNTEEWNRKNIPFGIVLDSKPNFCVSVMWFYPNGVPPWLQITNGINPKYWKTIFPT